MCDKPLYEQGFIILAHLGSLGLRIEVGGETRTTYPYFIISVLHLICSALLSLGGIFHAIFDPSSFLETIGVNVFAFCYQDRYRITAILGVHLGIIGITAIVLWMTGVYIGIYDSYASGGGDLRVVYQTNNSLN